MGSREKVGREKLQSLMFSREKVGREKLQSLMVSREKVGREKLQSLMDVVAFKITTLVARVSLVATVMLGPSYVDFPSGFSSKSRLIT